MPQSWERIITELKEMAYPTSGICVVDDPWPSMIKVVVLGMWFGRTIELLVLFGVRIWDLPRAHKSPRQVRGENRCRPNK